MSINPNQPVSPVNGGNAPTLSVATLTAAPVNSTTDSSLYTVASTFAKVAALPFKLLNYATGAGTQLATDLTSIKDYLIEIPVNDIKFITGYSDVKNATRALFDGTNITNMRVGATYLDVTTYLNPKQRVKTAFNSAAAAGVKISLMGGGLTTLASSYGYIEPAQHGVRGLVEQFYRGTHRILSSVFHYGKPVANLAYDYIVKPIGNLTASYVTNPLLERASENKMLLAETAVSAYFLANAARIFYKVDNTPKSTSEVIKDNIICYGKIGANLVAAVSTFYVPKYVQSVCESCAEQAFEFVKPLTETPIVQDIANGVSTVAGKALEYVGNNLGTTAAVVVSSGLVVNAARIALNDEPATTSTFQMVKDKAKKVALVGANLAGAAAILYCSVAPNDETNDVRLLG